MTFPSWQDISTAPKDGSEFLGFGNCGIWMTVWRWRVIGGTESEGNWCEVGSNGALRFLTHWMPLPPAPGGK